MVFVGIYIQLYIVLSRTGCFGSNVRSSWPAECHSRQGVVVLSASTGTAGRRPFICAVGLAWNDQVERSLSPVLGPWSPQIRKVNQRVSRPRTRQAARSRISTEYFLGVVFLNKDSGIKCGRFTMTSRFWRMDSDITRYSFRWCGF